MLGIDIGRVIGESALFREGQFAERFDSIPLEDISLFADLLGPTIKIMYIAKTLGDTKLITSIEAYFGKEEGLPSDELPPDCPRLVWKRDFRIPMPYLRVAVGGEEVRIAHDGRDYLFNKLSGQFVRDVPLPIAQSL